MAAVTRGLARIRINSLRIVRDTDAEGYWDGWMGVYDAGRTDNVVLYREHLDNGITGDETVDKQVGVHDVSAVSSADGADVDGDGTKEHSNVHIGELHWEDKRSTVGDPTRGSVTPDPGYLFEADFYEGIQLNRSQVEGHLNNVSENYALYGIDVRFDVDDDLTDEYLYSTGAPPFTSKGQNTLLSIENYYHNNDYSAYILIATDMPSADPVGDASSKGGTDSPLGQDGVGVAIYTEELRNTVPRGTFPTRFRSYTVHEVGHLFGAGSLDDDDANGEVYSGDSSDLSPERVGLGDSTWSVMAEFHQSEYEKPPMNGRYVAFSLEELMTVEFHKVDSGKDR